jgi:hypothetical protein
VDLQDQVTRRFTEIEAVVAAAAMTRIGKLAGWRQCERRDAIPVSSKPVELWLKMVRPHLDNRI